MPRVLKRNDDKKIKNCENEKHGAWSSNSSEQGICPDNSIMQNLHKTICQNSGQIAPCPMPHAPCKKVEL